MNTNIKIDFSKCIIENTSLLHLIIYYKKNFDPSYTVLDKGNLQ